ncbi:MAG: NYN domain-containing protein [Candidatus Niyogibacteria bacterium]|nr:NYN domain-containing protein [Candidatus Niyogibacteria bacterium]
MGRSAIGSDAVMQAVLDASSGNSAVDFPPVKKVKAAFQRSGRSISDLSLQKYLSTLERDGYIERVRGGPRGNEIERIDILKRSLPQAGAAPKLQAVRPHAKQPPKQSETTPLSVPTKQTDALLRAEVIAQQRAATVAIGTPPSSKPKNIALLVDWENTFLAGTVRGFAVSFSGIKKLVREQGRILFADVFVDPHTVERAAKSGASDTLRSLWDAGYHVIACPMGSKDADAVDTIMNQRARDYLELADIDILVVVSRDRDFRALSDKAADRGKHVVLFDVIKHRSHVEGGDAHFELENGREHIKLERAAEALKTARHGETAESEYWREYLAEIVRTITGIKAHGKTMLFQSFPSMQDQVQMRLDSPWKNQSGKILRVALTVLREKGAIRQITARNGVQYVIDPQSPIVQNACSVNLLASAG